MYFVFKIHALCLVSFETYSSIAMTHLAKKRETLALAGRLTLTATMHHQSATNQYIIHSNTKTPTTYRVCLTRANTTPTKAMATCTS